MSEETDPDGFDPAALEDKGSERQCIVTRARRAPEELMRFVRGPDGSVVPDLKRKLPGRGVWITPQRRYVADAVKKKLFSRAFRADTQATDALPDQVDALLLRAARDGVSLANKAGLVVSGFTKVESAIGSGGLVGLIEATDGAEDGRRKLLQAIERRRRGGGRAIPVLRGLSSEDLGLALGRSHVIHAALAEGPASRTCVARLHALEFYRASDAPAAGAPTAFKPSDPDDDQPARIRAE
jgi:predicted RNA-binding protein YlxR (DUF448 family)